MRRHGDRGLLTSEEKRRRLRRRLIVYGCLLSMLYGAYKFQPLEIDIIPRRIPPFVRVDPDSALWKPGAKVLVIAAHPDDSEFYVGGTLLKLRESGAKIDHLLHTDGDKAYYFWADNSKLREVRRREQRQASGRWGVQRMRFLGFPDGRLRVRDDTIEPTAAAIREWQPEFIFAFDGDYPYRVSHQDHRRSGDIGREAIQRAKYSGTILWYATAAPTSWVDVGNHWTERLELLAIHASQFREKLKFIEGMITDGAVSQGERSGVTFAEQLRVERFRNGVSIGRNQSD